MKKFNKGISLCSILTVALTKCLLPDIIQQLFCFGQKTPLRCTCIFSILRDKGIDEMLFNLQIIINVNPKCISVAANFIILAISLTVLQRFNFI